VLGTRDTADARGLSAPTERRSGHGAGRARGGDSRRGCGRRVRSVLRYIAEGYSGVEIGRILGVTSKSVDTYKNRIAQKLGFTHRMGMEQRWPAQRRPHNRARAIAREGWGGDCMPVYRSILVPLDGSALAEGALAVAGTLAERLGAELRLVHVHRPAVVDELATYGLTADAARSTAEHYILGVADRVRVAHRATVSAALVDGSAAESIVAHAKEVGSDLIVMASHGRTGASRFWLGSVADAVMRSADLPVLMVRGRSSAAPDATKAPFARLLVPLDGSAFAEQALPHAIALAKLGGADVHLLRVEEPAESLRTSVWALAPQEADDLPDRLRRAGDDLEALVQRFASEWAPAKASAEARAGRRVGDTIAEVAAERGTDLIAMTTHGRGASRMLVGSVADKVIRGTQCSVLLVATAHDAAISGG
jgi:nucleotide-binding universal stress UspA family protein